MEENTYNRPVAVQLLGSITELALLHDDRLALLVPGSGHLLHMSTHIDVLFGDDQHVVSRDQNAFLADQPFVKLRAANAFYTTCSVQNVHFVAHGAMFLSQQTMRSGSQYSYQGSLCREGRDG